MAAAWYVKNGYNVCFPKTSFHPGYDLLAEGLGKIFRVQVKTGSGYRNGYPRTNCQCDPSKCDVLFVLHSDNFARIYPINDAVTDVSFVLESKNKLHRYTVSI